MKHYKTVMEPRQELEKTTCDICGREILKDYTPPGDCTVYNERVEVSYYYSENSKYDGEEFDSHGWYPDICPVCFKEHVVKHLAEVIKTDSCIPDIECDGY